MAERSLRQFYDHDMDFGLPLTADDVVDPWLRHRHRFLEALRTLDDDQWRGPTRCDEWTVQEMINHLVTADGFFTFSLSSAANSEPTAFLRDFDPTTSPGEAAAGLGELSPAATLEAFDASTAALIAAVQSLDEASWRQVGESPLGHVPASMSLAHGAWDSMIHERDIFVPLDRAPDLVDDELWLAGVYSLWAAAIQGGLVGDTDAVDPGPDEPIEATLRFDEFSDRPIWLRIDETVRVEPVSAGSSTADADVSGRVVDAGSMLALIEGFTGRADLSADALPADLRAHLARAGEIL
jgi:uncharacterized protein (TIGR03083 family)